MLVLDIILLTLIFVLLTYIFLLDTRHRIIWNWSNITLLAFGALFLISFVFRGSDDIYKMFLTTGITSFVLFSLMSIALFYILGNDNWGGGDAKMIIASAPFLVSIYGLGSYILVLFLASLALKIIGHKNKETHVPFGPALSLALFAGISSSLQEIHPQTPFLIIGVIGCISMLFIYILAITVFKEKYKNWKVVIPEDSI